METSMNGLENVIIISVETIISMIVIYDIMYMRGRVQEMVCCQKLNCLNNIVF